MNTSYKLTTVFTSIKNNLKYLSLPFICFSFASVVEAFETIFKEELADGTLSLEYGPVTPEFKQYQTLTIKGLINWDGLLVKDVEIFFDGNNVAEVTARLFSFYGENSLKNLPKVYHPSRVRGKGLIHYVDDYYIKSYEKILDLVDKNKLINAEQSKNPNITHDSSVESNLENLNDFKSASLDSKFNEY